MATIAKKCSICGKMYPAYNYIDIPVSREDEEDPIYEDDDGNLINYEADDSGVLIDYRPNAFEFVTIKEDMDIQYDFDNQDLCPECMAAISNFIDTNTPHATGNPVILEDAAPGTPIEMVVATEPTKDTITVTRVGKNLINYLNNRTTNGITFAYSQETGGVSVVGTATSGAWQDAGISELVVAPYPSVNAGMYIISGAKSGIINFRVQAWYEDGTSEILVDSVTDSATFTLTKKAKLFIRCYVPKGTTVDDVVYPMVRYASVEDSLFEPYHFVTVEVNNSENLLSYPYCQTTRTNNGITFTDNEDGTITANGTATANAYFYFYHRNNQKLFLKQGQYTISDESVFGDGYTGVGINYTNSGGTESGVAYTSVNNISLFTVDEYMAENGIGAFIRVKSGATLNDVVFKPAVRKANQPIPVDIRLLKGSNTITADSGTITIKYKKAIEGKMEVES